MSGAQKKEPKGEERRRARRMMVSEAFSFFIVIPNKMGMSRIYMKDISKGGLSFWTESASQFSSGSELQIRLYTGPTLYLPVTVKVVRALGNEVAVEYLRKEEKAIEALAKFLEFLELATDAAVVERA